MWWDCNVKHLPGQDNRASIGVCDNFLYGFKAAPRGRSRRRLGGLVVAHADAPAPPGLNAGRLARKAKGRAAEPGEVTEPRPI